MTTKEDSADFSESLFLPKTDFAMRAGLPEQEPKILEQWSEKEIYKNLRIKSKGKEKFVLHDGPPYANGHLHIGHALNKILKDFVFFVLYASDLISDNCMKRITKNIFSEKEPYNWAQYFLAQNLNLVFFV